MPSKKWLLEWKINFMDHLSHSVFAAPCLLLSPNLSIFVFILFLFNSPSYVSNINLCLLFVVFLTTAFFAILFMLFLSFEMSASFFVSCILSLRKMCTYWKKLFILFYSFCSFVLSSHIISFSRSLGFQYLVLEYFPSSVFCVLAFFPSFLFFFFLSVNTFVIFFFVLSIFFFSTTEHPVCCTCSVKLKLTLLYSDVIYFSDIRFRFRFRFRFCFQTWVPFEKNWISIYWELLIKLLFQLYLFQRSTLLNFILLYLNLKQSKTNKCTA